MRVHDALRLSRRPRRVVYGDDLFLILHKALYRLRRSLGQVVLVRVFGLTGIVHPYHFDVFDVGQQVLKLGVGEDHLRPGMLDDIRDLIFAEPGVDRHEHEPGGRNTEVRLQHRWNVRAEERYPIPLAQAGILQPGRQTAYPFFKLLVSVAPVAVDHGGPIRVHKCAAL